MWAKEASQAFFEFAPDAVVIINVEGMMILVNAQTETMFGYPRHLLVGQSVEMLLPESARGSHVRHRSGYVDQPRVRAMGARLDLFGLRADGSEFPIGISLSPLDTGKGSCSRRRCATSPSGGGQMPSSARSSSMPPTRWW